MKLQALVTALLLPITGCYIDEQGAGEVKDAVPYEEVISDLGKFELKQGNSKIEIAGKLDYKKLENGILEPKEFHFKDLNPDKSDAPVETVSLSILGRGHDGVIYRGITDGGQEYWFAFDGKKMELEIKMTDGSIYKLTKADSITADEWNELTQPTPAPAPTPEILSKEVADILKTACGMGKHENALLPEGPAKSDMYFYSVKKGCGYIVNVGDNSWGAKTEFAKYLQKTGMRCTMAADGNLQFRFPKSDNRAKLNCNKERVDIDLKDDGSLGVKITDKDGSIQTFKVDSKGEFDGYANDKNGNRLFKIEQ